jgi:hypothetical protein
MRWGPPSIYMSDKDDDIGCVTESLWSFRWIFFLLLWTCIILVFFYTVELSPTFSCEWSRYISICMHHPSCRAWRAITNFKNHLDEGLAYKRYRGMINKCPIMIYNHGIFYTFYMDDLTKIIKKSSNFGWNFYGIHYDTGLGTSRENLS